MREEIRSLQKKLGVTMLYVTHDQVEAVTMADQVVLMNNGLIEQVDSPREMYEKPTSLFSAKFIGSPPMVTFSPEIFSKALPRELLKKTQNSIFGIRPECLIPHENGIIKGEIKSVEYLGADTMLECRVGSETLICRAPGQTNLEIGQCINLTFNTTDLHIFDTVSGNRNSSLISQIEMALPSQTVGSKPTLSTKPGG